MPPPLWQRCVEHAGGLFYFYLAHFRSSSTAELMMAEAVGLVNTLDNWRVVDKIILSTKTPEKKRIFGKGNFQSLTGIIHSALSCAVSRCVRLRMTHLLSFHPSSEKIRQAAGITAVFVNVERLSPLSEVSLSKRCSLAGSSCVDGHFLLFYTEGAGGGLGG